jgi:hypothetical protein
MFSPTKANLAKLSSFAKFVDLCCLITYGVEVSWAHFDFYIMEQNLYDQNFLSFDFNLFSDFSLA